MGDRLPGGSTPCWVAPGLIGRTEGARYGREEGGHLDDVVVRVLAVRPDPERHQDVVVVQTQLGDHLEDRWRKPGGDELGHQDRWREPGGGGEPGGEPGGGGSQDIKTETSTQSKPLCCQLSPVNTGQPPWGEVEVGIFHITHHTSHITHNT